MTTIFLRPVDDEGVLGAPIGSASDDDDAVSYTGSDVLLRHVAATALRFKVDEREAFALLARDGWSNGKLAIGTDASQARRVAGPRADAVG